MRSMFRWPSCQCPRDEDAAYGGGLPASSGADKVGPDAVLSHDGFYGGYYGGFDKDYAEYAGSPRDVADYSEKSNGNTIEIVRRRFFERGFDHIRCGDGRIVRLDEEYLRTTGS